ncbi:Glycosyl transferase family 2 [Limimonas halophila]|uniref:Glycosyl transferase family 2 n=1 Tax=Limimonas halophila TaxID=1082479 RepID=A0A1G7L660_9PROT|nr:glycosyltransferase [Limimonas halophila]SDF44560.1 Glycosyl transferase family 2 [Limimonas halophila]
MSRIPLPDVTVGIKAFMRQESLRNTLESLTPFDVHAVVVADDSGIDSDRRALYDEMAEKLPLTVIEPPRDTGVSVGRNRIFDACDSAYLLLLDDDHVVPENIGELREILEAHPELGGVSGIWSEWGTYRSGACNLYRLGPYLYRDVGPEPETAATPRGGTLHYYDSIPLSTLFRAEALKDVRWDESFKIGKAHLDFFLQHKVLGKWRFAITPSVVIGHYPATGTTVPKDRRPDTGYIRMRRGSDRLRRSQDHLNRKWGVRGAFTGCTHISTDNRGWKLFKHYALRPIVRLKPGL